MCSLAFIFSINQFYFLQLYLMIQIILRNLKRFSSHLALIKVLLCAVKRIWENRESVESPYPSQHQQRNQSHRFLHLVRTVSTLVEPCPVGVQHNDTPALLLRTGLHIELWRTQDIITPTAQLPKNTNK